MTAIKEVSEEQEDSRYALFDEISVRFMRAVKVEYGRDAAVDTLNHLQQTLGKEWAGRVVFHMMADNHQHPYSFTISIDPYYTGTVGKINCIKAVRALSNMGLGDAKTFVERAMDGIPQSSQVDFSRYDVDENQKARIFREQIQSIKSAGFRVNVV